MTPRFPLFNRLTALGPILTVLFVTAPLATACPSCDGGPTGVNEARREVFGPQFWPRLLATVIPFAVAFGVVATVLWVPGRRVSRKV